MSSRGTDPAADASDGVERPETGKPHGFGATRPGAVGTLVFLALVVLLFQRQLVEDRQRGPRRKASNVTRSLESDATSVTERDPAPAFQSSSRETAESRAAPPGTAPRGAELLRGRVLDPRGRPVPGARVSIGEQETRTDARGSFALPEAMGTLSVVHADFWSRELKRWRLELLRDAVFTDSPAWAAGSALGVIPPRSGPSELPILLLPGARVSGTVLLAPDSGGGETSGETKSVAGARVLISTGHRRWEVLTGDGGAFGSPLLPAKTLSLLVLYPGARPASMVLAPAPERWHHSVEVQLEKGVPLNVGVEDDDERPVGGAEVWIRAVPTGARGVDGPRPVEWEFVGWTDDLGRVDTARANYRPAWIQVKAPGRTPALRPLLGTESRIRLHRAPALEGTAVDAGTGLPVDLRSVRLEVREAGRFVRSPEHGQLHHVLGGGRFVVGLPPFPGVYRVFVRGAHSLAGSSEAVDFDGRRSPAPVLVPLDRRIVIGGHVWGTDGAVRGAVVELVSAPDADSPPHEVHGVRVPAPCRPVGSERTDHEGRFEFRDQGAGLYRLRVRLPGQREYTSPVFCPPLDEEVPIRLGRGSTLSGTLMDPGGAPEADVPLVLTDGNAVVRVAWTDSAGRYEFRDLAGGAYRLALGRAARRSVRAAVEVRELTIEEGRDLRFNVRRTRILGQE